MKHYRKRPVIIKAVQLTTENKDSIKEEYGFEDTNCVVEGLMIDTSEGVMLAHIGDYIIEGIKGEFYPCKEDIFILTYDEVEPLEVK